MNYVEKFIEAYAKAQLKDADETIRWAAKKMESYSAEFTAVINGKTKKDIPFIIATLETMAKGLRQQNEEFSKIADSLEQSFTAITILK